MRSQKLRFQGLLYDDVTYVHDDVTYVHDDVTCGNEESEATVQGVVP